MGKTKKNRKDESSDSEESSESSSSNSSSSSEATSQDSSSSADAKKSHRKRTMDKLKITKSKMQKKESSSSSSRSSSSDSNDNDDNEHNESKCSSSSETKRSKKEKLHKNQEEKTGLSKNKKIRSNKDEIQADEKNRSDNAEYVRKETSNLHNRSKWDSPGNDDDNKRERERERPKEKNWNKELIDNSNSKRYRRHDDNKSDRHSNRRNDYRNRSGYDLEKRRDRERESEHDRNRDRDQKFRSRDDNYNNRRYNAWENRNRKDNRDNRNHRDDRESKIQKDDRGNKNQRNDRENRRSRSPRRPRNFPRKRSVDDERDYEWGKKQENEKTEKLPEEREKPNFALSGKLTEDTNKVNGIVIKYAEPPESRKPKRRWRLYPFKGEKALPTLYIHRQSCYLIGRDRKVCDLPVDHPSCSKQHAAFQYRLVPFEREDGSVGKRVRPYLIDLESANGTFINNKKIESKKYIELLEKDVIKFGFSSREYVLLHENSKEDQLDDDITEEVQVKTEPVDD